MDIDGYQGHPWNRGRLCSKGGRRSTWSTTRTGCWKPLKRTAAGWQEIPLEQALDEIAERLRGHPASGTARAPRRVEGRGHRLRPAGGPGPALHPRHRLPQLLLQRLPCASTALVLGYSAGGRGLASVRTYEHARLRRPVGRQPAARAPQHDPDNHARAPPGRHARRAGPAPLGDRPPRRRARPAGPGTDGALAWGSSRRCCETRRLRQGVRGTDTRSAFRRLAEYARAFTPERVERETGVPAGRRAGSREAMAEASPRVVNYVGNGLEHHENGINNIRAVACLDALLGALEQGRQPPGRGLPLRDLTAVRGEAAHRAGPHRRGALPGAVRDAPGVPHHDGHGHHPQRRALPAEGHDRSRRPTRP